MTRACDPPFLGRDRIGDPGGEDGCVPERGRLELGRRPALDVERERDLERDDDGSQEVRATRTSRARKLNRKAPRARRTGSRPHARCGASGGGPGCRRASRAAADVHVERLGRAEPLCPRPPHRSPRGTTAGVASSGEQVELLYASARPRGRERGHHGRGSARGHRPDRFLLGTAGRAAQLARIRASSSAARTAS